MFPMSMCTGHHRKWENLCVFLVINKFQLYFNSVWSHNLDTNKLTKSSRQSLWIETVVTRDNNGNKPKQLLKNKGVDYVVCGCWSLIQACATQFRIRGINPNVVFMMVTYVSSIVCAYIVNNAVCNNLGAQNQIKLKITNGVLLLHGRFSH